jgi:hypothetical protein
MIIDRNNHVIYPEAGNRILTIRQFFLQIYIIIQFLQIYKLIQFLQIYKINSRVFHISGIVSVCGE